MIRGTTPDYILTLDGVDLSGKTVYVTIAQSARKLTLTGDELSIAVDQSGSTIAFMLTQKATLYLMDGPARVQVKFIDSTGYVQASEIATLTVDKALLERVIAYAPEN